MKDYNTLVNQADGARLTTDYTRYLVETQHYITQKTASILLGEETEDDDNSVPFVSKYKPNKIFVQVQKENGGFSIEVVDSPEEAKILASRVPGAKAYTYKGDEINLTEATENVSTVSRRQSSLAKKTPNLYKRSREEYEKALEKNIEEFINQQKQILGPDAKVDLNWAKENAKWKTVYDNPLLADVLDIEEYETQGRKIKEPLYVEKSGAMYIPRVGLNPEDIKPSSRMQYTGEAEGPINPVDYPAMKFVAPAHPDYIDQSLAKRFGAETAAAMQDPESIKMGLAMAAGGGAAIGGLRTVSGLLPQIPGVGRALTPVAPLIVPGAVAGLAGYGASSLKQSVAQSAAEALKGKSANVGEKELGRAAAETALGLGLMLPYDIGRAGPFGLRGRGPAGPKPTVPNPPTAQTQPFDITTGQEFVVSKLEPDAWLKKNSQQYVSSLTPEQLAALTKQSEALSTLKSDVMRPEGFPRPGMPGSRVRRDVPGGSQRISPFNLTKKELANIAKFGTDVEKDIVARANLEKLGKALGGKVGERIAQSDTPMTKEIARRWAEFNQSLGRDVSEPPSALEAERFKRGLGVSGLQPPVKFVAPPKATVGMDFPALPPIRPAAYETFDDYVKAYEDSTNAKISEKERGVLEKEYEASIMAERPAKVSMGGTPTAIDKTLAKIQSKGAKLAKAAAVTTVPPELAAVIPEPPPAIVSPAERILTKPQTQGVLRMAATRLAQVEPAAQTPKYPAKSTDRIVKELLKNKVSTLADRPTDLSTTAPEKLVMPPSSEAIPEPTPSKEIMTPQVDGVPIVIAPAERAPTTEPIPKPQLQPASATSVATAVAIAPVIQQIVNQLSSAKTTTPSSRPTLPPSPPSTPSSPKATGKGGGGVVVSPDDDYGLDTAAAERTKLGKDSEEWDLMLKQIYGRRAATLSK